MNVLPTMPPAAAQEDALWYKDAIIYQLHVKAFADSNDDGIGDFNGLTQRLDYLHDLGVTALWLLPFYPSPGRDDGYDIADYRRINPDFGTMKDFRRFMAEAKRRGIKIITELVINHTSDQHPWFKRARRSRPGSSARDWYVWSDTDQRYLGTRIIFHDTEKSNWTWDAQAQAYYWHRFFSHQPDLNYDNPRVLWAMLQVMRRWLDMGVDGFRLDAIPYLCEREGTSNENLPETHAVIKKLRAEIDAYAPGALLLAEANQWPEDVAAYFADGDECQMAYHFPLMPRIFMAIAQEDRFPITDIMRQTPDIPPNCQWALFLRNHDELTLEMVTDVERDYLWSTYATDPRARINFGIRRRLAPLMDNDRRKIELMNSLLLSFPGTPVIYYGDEIGMGDNIYLGDRNGVRTPMQWTPDRNGGFSRCDPAKLYLPPIMDPVYGFQAVNVEAQSRSLSSLLSWMKRMISVRKTSKLFGRGTLTFIRPTNRAVLVYLRQYGEEVMLCVANLSRSAQSAEIDLAPWKGRVPMEMLGRKYFKRIEDEPFVVTLAPYGFFWFLLEDVEPSADTAPHLPEWVTLVFSDGWRSMFEGRSRHLLEHDVLPPFLSSRRWFAEQMSGPFRTRLDGYVPLAQGDPGSALAIVEVTSTRGATRYALPVAVRWNRVDRSSERAPVNLLAPIRRANREGELIDALSDPAFVFWFIREMHSGAVLEGAGRKVELRATARFVSEPPPALSEIRPVTGEQSNSTVIVDQSYVLKTYRRFLPGINPEIEIGQFLTDVAGFANTPALLGSAELVEGDSRISLAVLHRFIANQGDGWTYTNAYLDRYLEEVRLLAPDAAGEHAAAAHHAAFLNWIRQIGRRTAELHRALSSAPEYPNFAPEPITPADIAAWTAELTGAMERMFDEISRCRPQLDARAQPSADILLARRADALAHIRDLLPAEIDADKIRHHGDLHLGQILVVKDDVFIIDFEGEPMRPGEARERKAPAARDVAGLVRSFDYATTAALARVVQAPPEEALRLAHALDAWRRQSVEALLDGIRDVASPARLRPREPEVAERLLQFYIIEKAVYEVAYEFANRPDWVHVPLTGLVRALFGEETP
jgi:maltose alpha-D-glucosyltransferase/alpha-amylase